MTPAMPQIMSATEFLTLLRKSALMEASELTKYLNMVTDHASMSPEELAARMQKDNILSPFQAHHLLRGRYKNFFIGKYKVLAPLGSGGMSQVFLCEHTVMKHQVALKLLNIKDNSDPQAIARFQREARAAAAVNHPNVVRAHDVDKADGKLYFLVMDYVDGVNLHDLVKRIGPLPAEQAANYIAQAAVGLHEIASKGLIHRDLKPSNLLLDREGVIRILDLGLACFADDSNGVTQQFQSESVFGTADYLAPEQALSMPDVDARADIYSLGATLYYLLSGQAPFENCSTAQKLLAHQMRDPDPIEAVPNALFQVMMLMMRKKPGDRLQQAYDVVEALTPWASLPLPMPPDDFFPPRAEGVSGPPTNGPRTSPSTAGHGKTATGGRFAAGRFLPAGPTSDLLRAGGNTTSNLGGPVTGPPAKQPNRMGLYIGAGIVATLLFAAGLFVSGVFEGSENENIIPQPVRVEMDPYPPAGSIVVGPKGKYSTVAAALAKAKGGSRIVIVAEEHVESLVVSKIAKDITIQGWPETRKMKWRPAKSEASAIVVRGAEGLTIANFDFDGLGTAKSLVEFHGACMGVTLSRCSITGFDTQAILLNNVTANSVKPMDFEHVQVINNRGTGICFAGSTKSVTIDYCRFEGPMTAAIDLGQSEAVTITACRFHQCSQAVSLTESNNGIRIAGNCFAECGTGLAFQTPLRPDRVSLRNNLFFKCGTTTSLGPTTGEGNVRDGSTKDGLNCRVRSIEALAGTDSNDDATFLRTPANLSKAGAEGAPVGVPLGK